MTVNVVELNKKIKSMNEDQRKVFDYVIQCIESRKMDAKIKPLCMFTSGVAGTGKSFLIECLTDKIRLMNAGDSNSVAVIAPTGIAAFNINGVTIHKFFKLPVQHTTEAEYFKLQPDDVKLFKNKWKKLDLIIMDECSMVSNVTLAMISIRLDECSTNRKWSFGSKNLIIFGDLLQLAPVNAQFIFEDLPASKVTQLFGGVGAYNFWNDFEYSELLKNMRQADDLLYAKMLCRIRIGCFSKHDIKMLKSLLISEDGTCSMEYSAKFLVKKCCILVGRNVFVYCQLMKKLNHLTSSCWNLKRLTLSKFHVLIHAVRQQKEKLLILKR